VIAKLVWASIRQRPARSLLLLGGYALGVGVTIALLSIGGALLEQSRDHQLLGGGDLVVLPAGIDLETLKTGGLSSMFFRIEQAPFLYREVLSSPRFEHQVEAAAPWIDDELVYLERGDELIPVSAGGLIPNLASAVGVEVSIASGRWTENDADRDWRSPSDSTLYASLDGFHVPRGEAAGDSTWAEWHYFNVLLPDSGGWLYLTYMIAGEVPTGRWGGRLLATLVEPGKRLKSFSAQIDPRQIDFAEGRADLVLGASSVSIEHDGAYRLTARIPAEVGRDSLMVDLRISANSRRYLPPLDIGGGALTSGYTVPLLDAVASGRLCASSSCRELDGARTYHDHNWGLWNQVTWDWGQATVGAFSVLYGGVAQEGRTEGSHFLYLADDEGFAGIYSIREVRTRWSEPDAATRTPQTISVFATQGRDSVHIEIDVGHTHVTDLPTGSASGSLSLYQMRGTARLSGRLRGAEISETGEGFFETWGSPSSGKESG